MKNDIRMYSSKQKACDHSLWLNFEHRLTNDQYGAIKATDGKYFVTPTDYPSFEGEPFETLPKSYQNMSYTHIKEIGMDNDPLPFWETIRAMVSTVEGETLRFVLRYQIPLEKFIRFELAARGYDADNRWCGFDTAKNIWLK